MKCENIRHTTQIKRFECNLGCPNYKIVFVSCRQQTRKLAKSDQDRAEKHKLTKLPENMPGSIKRKLVNLYNFFPLLFILFLNPSHLYAVKTLQDHSKKDIKTTSFGSYELEKEFGGMTLSNSLREDYENSELDEDVTFRRRRRGQDLSQEEEDLKCPECVIKREVLDKLPPSIYPPRDKSGGPMKLSTKIVVKELMDMSVKTETLTVMAWIRMYWYNLEVRWNQTRLNVREIRVNPNQVSLSIQAVPVIAPTYFPQ